MKDLSRLSRWKSKAEELVRYMERECVGDRNAVSADVLMERLQLTNDRDLRSIKDCAIFVLGVPIASTSYDGYCIPASYQDDAYDHSVRQKRRTAASYREVANAIDDAMAKRYGPPRLFEVGA